MGRIPPTSPKRRRVNSSATSPARVRRARRPVGLVVRALESRGLAGFWVIPKRFLSRSRPLPALRACRRVRGRSGIWPGVRDWLGCHAVEAIGVGDRGSRLAIAGGPRTAAGGGDSAIGAERHPLQSSEGGRGGETGGWLGFVGDPGPVANVGEAVGVARVGPCAKDLPAQADTWAGAVGAAHDVTVIVAPAHGIA